jgi:hypothetical protein
VDKDLQHSLMHAFHVRRVPSGLVGLRFP